MRGLIKCLYDDETQKSLESLYLDEDSKTQLLIRSVIAESLKDCPKIFDVNGADWVLCTLSSFHKSPDDTMRIYQSIMSNLNRFSVGLLDDKIKWRELNEIADSCLVGLSFFRRHMEAKHRRRALPSPDYYREAGSAAFHKLGFDEISTEFNSWVSFIEKEMTND